MQINKSLTVLAAVILATSYMIVGALTVSVSAAGNPFCWNSAAGGMAVEVSCDGTTGTIIRNVTGSAPQQEKCYEVTMGAIAMDYEDSRCVEARRADSNRSAPQCYIYSGSRNSYNLAEFDPSNVLQQNCDNAFKNRIKEENSSFSDFSPGFCYVSANDGYAAVSCDTHRTNVTSAQAHTIRDSGQPGQDPIHKVKGKCMARPLTRGDCPAIDYLFRFITALTALVGVTVAIMIVWGGIKYTSAKDNPQQAADAKETIRNAIIGLVAYFFIYAVLQWLVPGGVL